MPITRRELCLLLPGVALPAVSALGSPSEQDQSMPSKVFSFEKLQAETTNGGKAQVRPVLKGKLATGESLEVHETTLPPGGAPHPGHHHEHSEMWLVREGTVELTVNGKAQKIGPGGVGFVHSNDEHAIQNAGNTTAMYFVVAIGPGADA